MSYLLDTNVISEWTKPLPNAGVVAWLRETDESGLFVSVITLAEIRRGIERLEPGTRRSRLNTWLRDEIPVRFEGRILPVDADVADIWGHLMSRSQEHGRTLPTLDTFIAATAKWHELTLVTRNTADFTKGDLRLFNPWQAGAAP